MAWRQFACLGIASIGVLTTSCDILLVAIKSPNYLISSKFVLRTSVTGATGSVTYSCQLNSGPEHPCAPEQTYTELPDGRHSVTVNVVDEAGKRGTKTHDFEIYTSHTFPRIVLHAPSDGVTLRSSDVAVSFAIERGLPMDTQLCGLDSGPRVPCTSPHVFSNVPDGPHTITVSANSPGGWSTYDRASVRVSAKGPPLRGNFAAAHGVVSVQPISSGDASQNDRTRLDLVTPANDLRLTMLDMTGDGPYYVRATVTNAGPAAQLGAIVRTYGVEASGLTSMTGGNVVSSSVEWRCEYSTCSTSASLPAGSSHTLEFGLNLYIPWPFDAFRVTVSGDESSSSDPDLQNNTGEIWR